MNYDEMDSLIETLEKRITKLEETIDLLMKIINIMGVIMHKINKLKTKGEEKAND